MDEVERSLRKRYSHIHPLIYQRSKEKARTNGELFDILDTVPDSMPVVWDEQERRWVVTEDLLQRDNLEESTDE